MTQYEALLARLRRGEQVMIDGGTGTEVERRGVPQLPNAWNGGGALSHPEVVRAIHEDYIAHGAEIIIANTFATSRNLLEDAGQPELFEAYNRRAVEIACEARGARDILVAGGLSHWSFSGRVVPLADQRDGAAEQARIMAEAGADLLMLEMMVDVARMEAVLEGALGAGLPVWVGISCARDEGGIVRLQAGEADTDGYVQASGETLADAVLALGGYDIPLVSIMHTDVRDVPACLDVLDQHWTGLRGVYAHSGAIIDGQWQFNDTISPADYAREAAGWKARGVSVIGGCCGIRPDHMAEVAGVMSAG
ncbi:MAG: homocysteine S-methyltransferase family protein [Pseudomonadota bacterium]